MKVKRLFTLAALLTSSLAGAIDLENKYYAGVNFGGQYAFGGGGSALRPSLLIGYHYEKSSKLELEVNGTFPSLTNFTLELLGNYRYYPKLDIDPVTLYVSGGLGASYTVGGVSSTSTGSGDNKGTSEVKVVDPKDIGGGSDTGNAPVPTTYADEVAVPGGPSILDKVLGHFSYKLKVGVDYEFTPQIVGAVGINLGGSFYSLTKLQAGTGIELGIRYNF